MPTIRMPPEVRATAREVVAALVPVAMVQVKAVVVLERQVRAAMVSVKCVAPPRAAARWDDLASEEEVSEMAQASGMDLPVPALEAVAHRAG